MTITEVRVYAANREGKLKAYATVVFDDSFIVRNLKIIEGAKGLFISMPSQRRPDGTFRDIAHPLNSATRNELEEAILKVYNAENNV